MTTDEELKKKFVDALEKYNECRSPENAGRLYIAARDYKLNARITDDGMMRELDRVQDDTFEGRKQFLVTDPPGATDEQVTITFSCNRLVRLINAIESITNELPESNWWRVTYPNSEERIVFETVRDLIAEARAKR